MTCPLLTCPLLVCFAGPRVRVAHVVVDASKPLPHTQHMSQMTSERRFRVAAGLQPVISHKQPKTEFAIGR